MMSELKVYRRRVKLTGNAMEEHEEQGDVWTPETPKKQSPTKPQEKVFVKSRTARIPKIDLKSLLLTNAELDPGVEAVKGESSNSSGERSVLVDTVIGEKREQCEQGEGACLENVELIDLNKSVWVEDEDAGSAEMESGSEVVDLTSEKVSIPAEEVLPHFDLPKETKDYGRTNLQQKGKSKNGVRGQKVKRKKHRPKVIIDRGQEKSGRAKRKLNLETPKKAKEKSPQRRNYVRKVREKSSSSDVSEPSSANSMVVQMAEPEQVQTMRLRRLQRVEAEQQEVMKLRSVGRKHVDPMLISLRKIDRFALILKKTRGKRIRKTYFGLKVPESFPANWRGRRSRRICALKYAAKRVQLLDIDLNQTQEFPVAEEQFGSSSAFHDSESSLISVPVHSVGSLPYSEFHNHESSLMSAAPVHYSDFHYYENSLVSIPVHSVDQSIPILDFHNCENSLVPIPANSDFQNYGYSPISVPALPQHYGWPYDQYPASLYAPAPLWAPSMPLYHETVQPSSFPAGSLDLTVSCNLDFWANDYELIHYHRDPMFSPEKGIKRSKMEFIIRKLQTVHISDQTIKWVQRKQRKQRNHQVEVPSSQYQNLVGALVPYVKELPLSTQVQNPESALVPSGKKRKKFTPKIVLDSETIRVWNKLMHIDDGMPDLDAENEQWWEGQREAMRLKVECFVSRMHLIQGNRQFREWKGSVVDSVVGVFLTQNVSDYLSSSAYMSLGAKFGRPTQTSETHYGNVDLLCSQESVGSNSGYEYFVSEPEPERGNLENTRETLVNMVDELSSFHIEDITWTPLSQEEITFSQVTSNHELEVMEQCDDAATMNKKGKMVHTQEQDSSRGRKASSSGTKVKKEKEKVDWDSLRKAYCTGEPRSSNRMDSIDWEAVRQADTAEIADAIKERGQHRILAGRIKDFLNGLVDQHGSIDLEWLRNVPPDKAKDYLLDVPGLGLKSVECVRLLSLQNVAFPVDTNVGRIAVRLGWVPLQTLPEQLQLHLLEQYPVMDTIQKYLWPRLCTLDQKTLYELHYQLITFGKVFCTKVNPNCNACPMKGDCRHFASAFASARLALPAPPDKRIVTSKGPAMHSHPVSAARIKHETRNVEPIIEEPGILDIEDMLSSKLQVQEAEPECDSDGIPIFRLNVEKFKTTLLDFMKDAKMVVPDDFESRALVVLDPAAASIPAPKLKQTERLRTEHLVYELPPNHCLLDRFEKLEPSDLYKYHLAIWLPGETPNSIRRPQRKCDSEGSDLCYDHECYSCNNTREQLSNTVRGTILIPSRTAMRGSFPLNGTYFQHNEVFADHRTSRDPIEVPRDLIYNLPKRTAYFGSSTSAVTKGLTTREIQELFWHGIVCFRGFERRNGAPRNLVPRLHYFPNKVGKRKRED